MPGRSRTITPASASRSAWPPGRGPPTRRAWCPARHGEAARGQPAASAPPGRRHVHARRSPAPRARGGGERERGRLARQRGGVEAAGVARRLRSRPGVAVLEGHVARRDRAHALAERRLDVEHPGPVRRRTATSGRPPRTPRSRARGRRPAPRRALRAVEHHRHVDLRQRGGRDLARDPGDVRAGHQRRPRVHRVGDLAQRHGTDRRAALAGRDQRPDQARVLAVGGHDLVARPELEPGEHRAEPLARRRSSPPRRRRRSRAPSRTARAAPPAAPAGARSAAVAAGLELAGELRTRRSTAAAGTGPSVPALRYAIARGRGTRHGGLHAPQTTTGRRPARARRPHARRASPHAGSARPRWRRPGCRCRRRSARC